MTDNLENHLALALQALREVKEYVPPKDWNPRWQQLIHTQDSTEPLEKEFDLEIGSPVMDSDGDIYFIRQFKVIRDIPSVDCGEIIRLGESYSAGWSAVADLKAPLQKLGRNSRD